MQKSQFFPESFVKGYLNTALPYDTNALVTITSSLNKSTTYHTCLHLETYKHHSGPLCLKEQKHPYHKSLSMAV